MLGWHISAYRFGDDELRAARCDRESMLALLATKTGLAGVPLRCDSDVRLAAWQTTLGGTDWLDQLVASEHAAATARAGYPDTYLLRFARLSAQFDRGLFRPGIPWRSGAGDMFLPGYLGTDSLFPEVIAATDAAEWVLVVAWDES